MLSQLRRANCGNSSMDIPSIPGAPLLALTRFHARCMFSMESIRSSRWTSGLDGSMTRRMVTPPVGFFVSCKLIDSPSLLCVWSFTVSSRLKEAFGYYDFC